MCRDAGQLHLKACCRNPAAERSLRGGTTSCLPRAIQKMRHPSRWCTQLHLWVTGRPIKGSAYENKWVSRASACLSADSHSWARVLFLCLKKETLQLPVFVHLFVLWRRARRLRTPSITSHHLRGVCYCTNSRPFAVSIVTKPSQWEDRVAPAQCRFTGLTRHSQMWVGRVNPRNQKAVNLWPLQYYVTKHAKDECRMVEAKLCLFRRWHLLTEHCV